MVICQPDTNAAICKRTQNKNLTLLTKWPLMRNNFLHALPAQQNSRRGA
jgi:hypothetical protein